MLKIVYEHIPKSQVQSPFSLDPLWSLYWHKLHSFSTLGLAFLLCPFVAILVESNRPKIDSDEWLAHQLCPDDYWF
ncbi:MAG: hypothetical protein KDD61_17070 [Bdellovibrionales bacterium]|nr:hypothetical protein [Bdellovibrionales bacterium]